MLSILTQSFWRDEAFSVILAEKNIFEIFNLSTQDPSPPFYYLLLHYWIILFGNGEIAVRFLSLLFHLLTVIVMFLIAKHLIRSLSGQIIIALTTLLNPFLLQYAFEARAYSLVVFLSITALYLIILKKKLLAGIFLSLAIFSHNFAVITFFILTAWWLFVNRKNLRLSSFLKLVSFPLLTIFLWGGAIWIQWSKFAEGFWISKPTISTLTNSFKIFSSGEISYSAKFILYSLSLVFLFLAGLSWLKKDKSKNNNILFLFFLLAVIPTLSTFVFSLLFTPIYYERYLILTTPMLILLTGYSLNMLLKTNFVIKFFLAPFIVIYLIVLVISSFQVVSKPTKANIGFGVKEIISRTEKNDIIVPKTTLNFLEVKYYVQRSGKNIPVYAYSQNGKVPFYIGGILYEPQDVIREMPKNKRVWQIKPNGQYELLEL
ncbi:MAG: glycosyltransferase family 39 protein [Candidatus Levybacteria bacterium]|nr:glycosyltransferase family 39 protein [Candidatus Levybacteria bacterium]